MSFEICKNWYMNKDINDDLEAPVLYNGVVVGHIYNYCEYNRHKNKIFAIGDDEQIKTLIENWFDEYFVNKSAEREQRHAKWNLEINELKTNRLVAARKALGLD
jgi:hypothetical protein